MVKPRQTWKRTRVIQLALVSLLLGLALSEFGWTTNWHILLALLPLLLITPRLKRLIWLVVAVSALALGIWRGQLYLRQLQPITQRVGMIAEIEAVVTDEVVFTDNFQSEFHVEGVEFMPERLSSAGRLTIRGFAGNKINRGDRVRVKGKLYSTRGGSIASISFAQIQIIGVKQTYLETWRRRFVAGIHTALSEPHGTLGLGFLVGGRSQLPDDLQNQLALTGLTHIVAVSGFNLTILVRATRRLLAKRSKYLSTLAALGLVAVFIAITGNSPSIARAAVVSVIAIAAWYYGRPLKPVMLLLLAAVATAMYRPTYLWSDIGWSLSFLAFAGVLLLAPAVETKLKISKKSPQWLLILIETLSAQALTLPLIVHTFGQVSLIAPIANLMVLPLIPLTMLLVLIAGLAGVVMPAVVGWLAWPAQQLLQVIILVVQKLGSLPVASAKLNFSLGATVCLYLAIGLFIFTLRYRIGNKQLTASIIE